jgi:hypothetical protein
MQCTPFSSCFLPLRLKYLLQDHVPKYHQPSCSLNVTHQDSHPYKTYGWITVMFTLVYIHR